MKKFALLIGVEDYRDKMISRLNLACADAIALAERLSGRCGFDHVRVLADESGEDEPLLVNIVTALRDTASELRQDDLFLFFFAGHGIEKDGHGYLMARDSLHAFPEHGSLSLELLRKTFEYLSAGKRILLLDACRNSPDAGRSDAANYMGDVISRDIVAAARSKLAGGTTTALLATCRLGQRAYEWPAKGHGVFTQCLLEGIDGAAWASEKLDFKQLASFAAQEVRQWTANTPGLSISQEPWYEEFGHPDSLVIGLRGQRGKRSGRSLPSKSADSKIAARARRARKGDVPASQAGTKQTIPAAAMDPRFTCPVCSDLSDAVNGNLCTKCNRFVHTVCQKCGKKRWSFDLKWWLTAHVYSYVCPLCGTVVRKEKRTN